MWAESSQGKEVYLISYLEEVLFGITVTIGTHYWVKEGLTAPKRFEVGVLGGLSKMGEEKVKRSLSLPSPPQQLTVERQQQIQTHLHTCTRSHTHTHTHTVEVLHFFKLVLHLCRIILNFWYNNVIFPHNAVFKEPNCKLYEMYEKLFFSLCLTAGLQYWYTYNTCIGKWLDQTWGKMSWPEQVYM